MPTFYHTSFGEPLTFLIRPIEQTLTPQSHKEWTICAFADLLALRATESRVSCLKSATRNLRQIFAIDSSPATEHTFAQPSKALDCQRASLLSSSFSRCLWCGQIDSFIIWSWLEAKGKHPSPECMFCPILRSLISVQRLCGFLNTSLLSQTLFRQRSGAIKMDLQSRGFSLLDWRLKV